MGSEGIKGEYCPVCLYSWTKSSIDYIGRGVVDASVSRVITSDTIYCSNCDNNTKSTIRGSISVWGIQ